METLPLPLSAPTTRATVEATETLIDQETTVEMVVETAEALTAATTTAVIEATETKIKKDNVTLIVIAAMAQDQAVETSPPTSTPVGISKLWLVPPFPRLTGARCN